MAISITINGSALPAGVKFRRNSLNISHELGSRAVCDFELTDENGNYALSTGYPVEITEDGTIIFSGSIDEPDSRKTPGSSAKYHSIVCVDNHHNADRRIVSESYSRQVAGNIAKNIITNYLAAEGITQGTIQDGPEVGPVNFPDIPASQCIDELAELVGFQWRINADKSLDFYDQSTFTAAEINENSDILADSVHTWEEREEYRNRQILKNVKGVTTLQTETPAPAPDGETRTFTLRFPVNQKPVIEIDTGAGFVVIDPADIGINGIDSGKKWYWNKGSNQVTQDTSETVLSASDAIRVKYYGEYTTKIVVEDAAAIAERKSVEGGSGIYERVEDAPAVEDVTAGEEKAQALLQKYTKIAKKVEMSSHTINFKVGEIRRVVLPSLNINGEYLVMSVNITDPGRADEKLMRTAVLVDGSKIGGWVKFFQKWLEKTRDMTIRPDEVVRHVASQTETEKLQNNYKFEYTNLLYPADDLYPSDTLYPNTAIIEEDTIYD